MSRFAGEHELFLFLLQFALLLIMHEVVMATGRKPVTQRAFFGHRIDSVVEHAPCPVAIVSAR